MRHMISAVAVAGLLLAGGAASASAQGGGRGQGFQAPPDHWLTMDSLVAAVGISSDQKADAQKDFDAIQDAYKQAAKEREKMRSMFQSGTRPSDEERQQMRTTMQNLQKQVDDNYGALRGMLSADQQAKLDALPKPELFPNRRGGMRGGSGQ